MLIHRSARFSSPPAARDEVEANGQRFLFRPRSPRPPIIVGGAPPHAIRRAVRFGEGWMPTAAHAEVLHDGIASLREGMAAGGKPAPKVVLLQPLPVEDDERLASRLNELEALGVSRSCIPGATAIPGRSRALQHVSSQHATAPCRWPDVATPGRIFAGGSRRSRALSVLPRCPLRRAQVIQQGDASRTPTAFSVSEPRWRGEAEAARTSRIRKPGRAMPGEPCLRRPGEELVALTIFPRRPA